MHLTMSATNTDSWANLQTVASQTKVGAALDLEVESRIKGTGAPFVQNNLRLFGSNERPKLTLFRDHAGECLVLRHDMLCLQS
jgi:glutathione S-transferase